MQPQQVRNTYFDGAGPLTTNDRQWGRPAVDSVAGRRKDDTAGVVTMRTFALLGTTRRTTVSLVAGFVVFGLMAALIVAGATPAAAQNSAVTVTNASTSEETPTAGETFVVRVRIANAGGAGANYDLDQVDDFDLNQVHVETPRGRSYVARDLGTLAPGSATTVRIPVRVHEPGSQTLSVRVYGQDGVSIKNIQHPVPVEIEGDRSARISMAASADDLGPSGRTDVDLTVANGFDQAISGIELTVQSDDLTLPESQRVTSGLPPGNVTRFSLSARDVEPGPQDLAVTMNYTTTSGDRQTVRRNLTAVVSQVSEPGRIRLTELDVAREGQQLVVRGSASNVGTTDVSGVVIGVEDTNTAAPAGGASDFFVGEVPASDFSSFDVSVAPQTNGTVTIPLNVSYVVDGERTSRIVEVTHQVSAQSNDAESDGGGGSSLPLLLGVLVLVGAAVFGWRRYRG